MKIIYRISDTSQGGHYKIKPEYINNENCLKNALLMFPPYEQVIQPTEKQLGFPL